MSTIKLSDTQLVVLNTAAKAVAPIGPEALTTLKAKGAARTRAVNGLLKRGLLEEVAVKPGEPVWRKDKDGRAVALTITAEGCAAIGVEPVPGGDNGGAKPGAGEGPSFRPGTKQARLVELLAAEGGATISALTAALAWQPHSVRAAITGLRKLGLAVTRAKDDAGVTVYRVAEGL
jgi:DNA-binding MarR family transcriptional regulator